jgi:hypothetical protein
MSYDFDWVNSYIGKSVSKMFYKIDTWGHFYKKNYSILNTTIGICHKILTAFILIVV